MKTFEHNDLCVGIDLGTTNSALATINIVNGKINSPVRNIQRFSEINSITGRPTRTTNALLPSCVYYRQERDGEFTPVVGDYAKRQYALKPWLVSRSVKSQMGEESVTGLSEEVPDKKPEEVSARILKHLIADAEDHFMCKIDDVVITVPASFNSAMREATLKAAEIAGINVRKEDGSFDDDMLISEPEAVMYDLINQIQEGLFDANIDFSEKKRVMVFDIGGGTLDITIHEVSQSKENAGVLNISPIAINRYTKIGGDDFDEMVADEMYNRYLELYSRASEIVEKIKKDSSVKPNLLAFAEELKLNISDQYFELKQRGVVLDDDKIYECGGLLGNGYSYDDSFTKLEYEDVVAPLMGYDLKLEDYKTIDKITDTYNIVYPILNVMKKASEHLNCEDVKIDAVVLNGGMSKLYLIQNRIESLFGFKPLMVADPDKSVAMGAAVYHHYLHKKTDSVRKMRVEYDSPENKMLFENENRGITTSQSILNEDIYLGLKGGASCLLCKAGTTLPFKSEVMTGFAIDARQNLLSIPIKELDGKNGYKTMACGTIQFSQKYTETTPVSIQFSISKSQILTLEAWTSKDEYGVDVIEKGNVVLKFGHADTKSSAAKMLPKSGTKLIVANELYTYKSLMESVAFIKPKTNKGYPNPKIKDVKNRIKTIEMMISTCGNPEEFADPIIDLLASSNSEFVKQRLLILSRKLSKHWSEEQRGRLGRVAYQILSTEFCGFNTYGEKINTNSYAIQAIGCSGDKELCKKLIALADKNRYTNSLVYAFAQAKVNVDWIYDYMVWSDNEGRSMQNLLWGIAVGMQNAADTAKTINAEEVLKTLIGMLNRGSLNRNDVVHAIIALGTICDQRQANSYDISEDLVALVIETIDSVKYIYPYDVSVMTDRACYIAKELCKGTMLSKEDEEYLLGLLTYEGDAE